jgi:hypothetical protein
MIGGRHVWSDKSSTFQGRTASEYMEVHLVGRGNKGVENNLTCYNQMIVAIVDVLTSFIFIFANDNR